MKELLRNLYEQLVDSGEQSAERRERMAARAQQPPLSAFSFQLSAFYLTVTLICEGYRLEWWIAFRANTPLVSS